MKKSKVHFLQQQLQRMLMSLKNGAKKVYPCAYTTSALGDGAVEANNWYTASNKNPDSATDAVFNYQKVLETNSSYLLKYTFKLTLTKDSETFKGTLKFTFSKGAADDALSACIKIGEEMLFLNSAQANKETTANYTINGSGTVDVVVLIYIDGTSANVNTNKISAEPTALNGTVSIQVDLGTAAVGA